MCAELSRGLLRLREPCASDLKGSYRSGSPEWNRGGDFGWLIFNPDGHPKNERGNGFRVPGWSHVAAYAEPDDNFVSSEKVR
jgi:hypothetical protein